jgi:hypothetical protein
LLSFVVVVVLAESAAAAAADKVRDKKIPSVDKSDETSTRTLCENILLHVLYRAMDRPKGQKRQALSDKSTEGGAGAAKLPRLVAAASPKYEVSDDDDWPPAGAERPDFCWRCLKAEHYDGQAAACPSLSRRCAVCERLGHVPALHQVRERRHQDRILAAITDPETGDYYDRRLLWPPSKDPKVIDVSADIIEIPDDSSPCDRDENSIEVVADISPAERAEIFARSAQILAELEREKQLRDIHRVQAAAFRLKRRELADLDKVTAAAARQQQQRPRSAFSCSVCNISCNSAERLRCHVAGAKHRKQLQRLPPAARAQAAAAVLAAEEVSAAVAAAAQKENRFTCDLCGTVVACAVSFRSHLEGKRHLKNLLSVSKQKILEASLQDRGGGPTVDTVVIDDDSDKEVVEIDQEVGAGSTSGTLPAPLPNSSPAEVLAVPVGAVVQCSRAQPACGAVMQCSRAQILRSIPNAIDRTSVLLKVRPDLLPQLSCPQRLQYRLSISALRSGECMANIEKKL